MEANLVTLYSRRELADEKFVIVCDREINLDYKNT